MEDKIREYVVFFEQTRTETKLEGRKVRIRQFVHRYFPKSIKDLNLAIKQDLTKIEFEGVDRGIRVEAEVIGIYRSQEYEKFELPLD